MNKGVRRFLGSAGAKRLFRRAPEPAGRDLTANVVHMVRERPIRAVFLMSATGIGLGFAVDAAVRKIRRHFWIRSLTRPVGAE
jgi:hypothetical protein